jgi:hypothetical protein
MKKKLLSLALALPLLLVGCSDKRASDPNCSSYTNWKGQKDYTCIEPSTEPVKTVSGTESDQAQQWLNSANQEPTWSGHQFEENQRKAWAK